MKILRTASAVWFALLCGCSSGGKSPTTIAAPTGESTPRVLTDLSTLSSAPSAAAVAPALGSLTVRESEESKVPSGSEGSELRRLFLEKPGTRKFAGTAARPGEERLLNAKASQFSQFSGALLHKVFIAAQELERGEIARQALPEKLNSAVITAIMNKDGKLKELILEEHSGSGAVDKLLIEACKQGLWATNPPTEALSTDGNYKFRIEGRLKNFNSANQRYWNFETYVGLALL